MSSGTLERLPRNDEGLPRYFSVLIFTLVLAFVGLGVFTYYKWTVREPVITPQEADIKYLQQLAALNPKDADSMAALAYSFQKSGKLPEARQQYLKAIKINPKHMASLYNLGYISLVEKKYAEAESYYKKTLAVNPKHYLANLGLGEVYLATGKYDLAIQKANSQMKENQVLDPILLKAMALEKKGKKAEAKTEYQKVLRFLPSQPDALKGMARLK